MGAVFLRASRPRCPFPFCSFHAPFILIPVSEPCPRHSLVSVPLLLSLEYQCLGRGLSSRACCCDLDFRAETVLVLTVGERCSWPSLAGPPLGPSVWLHLGVQVSMHASACFSGGHAGPAAWLIVCLCHGACHQGRLVCSGPSRGLGMGPAGSTPLTIWWPCFSTSAFLHINRKKEMGCVSQPLSAVFLAHSWRDLWAVSYKVISLLAPPLGLATDCLWHNLFL